MAPSDRRSSTAVRNARPARGSTFRTLCGPGSKPGCWRNTPRSKWEIPPMTSAPSPRPLLMKSHSGGSKVGSNTPKSRPTSPSWPGGDCDDRVGYFIEPTIIETKDPKEKMMAEEIFGPVLTVYVYPENEYKDVLRLIDTTSPYGLTGAVFSQDKNVLQEATEVLRNAAGNFYINDKSTGAVVAQQPFGGAPSIRYKRQARGSSLHPPLDLAAGHQGNPRPSDGMEVPLHAV
ncbi:unnamed protein product, partial [Staurois parvus]